MRRLVKGCLEESAVEAAGELRQLLRDEIGLTIPDDTVGKELAVMACLCAASQAHEVSYFDTLDSPGADSEVGNGDARTTQGQLAAFVEPADQVAILLNKLDAALSAVGRESERYLRLAACLGEANSQVLPLDSHYHLLQTRHVGLSGVKSTTDNLEDIISQVQNERKFWSEMESLVDQLASQSKQESAAWSKESPRFSTPKPIDVLNHHLEQFKPAMEARRSNWSTVKKQLNKQTYARLTARFKERAKTVSLEFEESISKQKSVEMLCKERAQRLEAVSAPFFDTHPQVRKHVRASAVKIER
jgi:hypothetical protein